MPGGRPKKRCDVCRKRKKGLCDGSHVDCEKYVEIQQEAATDEASLPPQKAQADYKAEQQDPFFVGKGTLQCATMVHVNAKNKRERGKRKAEKDAAAIKATKKTSKDAGKLTLAPFFTRP